MIADPKSKSVTLKKMDVPGEFPPDSVIYRNPVAADWGL